VNQYFLPIKTKLITERTLFARIYRDVGWMLYEDTKFQMQWFVNKKLSEQVKNNDLFLRLLKKQSSIKSTKPKFVYGHLFLPHFPFFFDKHGNLKDMRTVYLESNPISPQAYLDYVGYTNTQMKDLINSIQNNTAGNAVIIIMSDHGFRTIDDMHSKFQNLNAVYFPDKDYRQFYDSISAVNQFRVIFNELFKQSNVLLKDSTIFLQDK